MKILLAEDEVRLAEALVHILRRQGYQVDAAASHELRTPLAALRVNLELVMDCREETVASQLKWLENMDAESRRMPRLIDDLLTLARADANRQEFACEEFSMGQAAGEVVAACEASAGRQGIRLELMVQDNGCGIGEEHLGRLFERFYRVTEMRGKNPDGSGLGLAIARWIAEGHGGKITVRSTVGRGTEFVVSLPVRGRAEKIKKGLAQNSNS